MYKFCPFSGEPLKNAHMGRFQEAKETELITKPLHCPRVRAIVWEQPNKSPPKTD